MRGHERVCVDSARQNASPPAGLPQRLRYLIYKVIAASGARRRHLPGRSARTQKSTPNVIAVSRRSTVTILLI